MNSLNILFVHLYSNGDCLLATAVARQIKRDFPSCHLTWAISASCKNILINNPYIDNIWEISSVPKDDIVAFRRFKNEVKKKEQAGAFNKVFITQIQDKNLALYDGCIRSNIFNAYPFPITVPVQPVLRLSKLEQNNVHAFVEAMKLNTYDQVILFEFAPQSGQSKISTENALSIAENIVNTGKAAVILSSYKRISHANHAIIDGSKLSIRETAYLTHYCTFLLGTSSGITWISTSEAGKILPMVQLLNASGKWLNAVSRDFERFGIPNKGIIELLDYNEQTVIDCITSALQDFESAKERFNQPIPLNFKTTRHIVYNLLCYFHFNSIRKHILCNLNRFGFQSELFVEVSLGFLLFPYFLIRNKLKKMIFKQLKTS